MYHLRGSGYEENGILCKRSGRLQKNGCFGINFAGTPSVTGSGCSAPMDSEADTTPRQRGANAADYPRSEITGVVLAGGRARRMGGEDKGLVEVAGRPMVEHVVDALRPQVKTLLINANRNLDVYRALGRCAVVADTLGDFAGPLAGMASAMQEAATTYVLTAPCDSPLVSGRLAELLYATLAAEDAEVCVAHDGERMQPVFALLRRDLHESIVAYLRSGERKIDQWYAQRRVACGDLSAYPDTFANINTPEDRRRIEARLNNRAE